MKSKIKGVLIRLTLLALPVVFAACGGDNSASPSTPDAATSAAFKQVQSTVRQVNQQNTSQLVVAPESLYSQDRNEHQHGSSVQPKSTKSIGANVNCTGGGTASVSGTLTGSNTGLSSNPQVIDLSYSYSVSFINCVTTDSDGNNYTINSSGITSTGTDTGQPPIPPTGLSVSAERMRSQSWVVSISLAQKA